MNGLNNGTSIPWKVKALHDQSQPTAELHKGADIELSWGETALNVIVVFRIF